MKPEPVEVKVVASSVEHEGIPMRRLPNGDYVYIAPTDYHVPRHVIDRYKSIEEPWEWQGS